MKMRPLSSVKAKNNTSEELIESITKLDSWITTNGWAGYDPYDIKGHPWCLKLIGNQKQDLLK